MCLHRRHSLPEPTCEYLTYTSLSLMVQAYVFICRHKSPSCFDHLISKIDQRDERFKSHSVVGWLSTMAISVALIASRWKVCPLWTKGGGTSFLCMDGHTRASPMTDGQRGWCELDTDDSSFHPWSKLSPSRCKIRTRSDRTPTCTFQLSTWAWATFSKQLLMGTKAEMFLLQYCCVDRVDCVPAPLVRPLVPCPAACVATRN